MTRVALGLWVAVVAASALLAFLLFARGSSSDDTGFDGPAVIQERPISPSIYTTELVVGRNRFLLALLQEDGSLVTDAEVHLRFYDLNGEEPVMTSEMAAIARVPARDAGISEVVEHEHADGSTHLHANAGEEAGFYTAQVEFPRAGNWGVEVAIDAQQPKVKDALQLRFNVLERGETPAIGSPAPRSRNLTLTDVKDVAEIDSSTNPEPGLHQTTIADAIAASRPAVVFFGVPGYCTSQLCGPEYEILRKLYEKRKADAAFIHVEFYKEPGNPEQERADAAVEWNLRTEPWFFVIDSRGLISAKFDGPATLQELEQALDAALGR